MAKTELEPKFHRGDEVALISGGPLMTVIGMDQDGKVQCIWFLRQEESWEGPFEAAFYPELLEENN